MALHRRALPHGFFVGLGPRYLTTYYRCFIEGPEGVAIVAILGGQPIGVLVGTMRNRAHYAWVARERTRTLAGSGAAGLVANPRLAWPFVRTRLVRFVRGLVRLRRDRPTPHGSSADDVAILTHLAVEDRARGLGAGAALVAEFEAIAATASAAAQLVTLSGAAGAGPFYERLGWVLVETRSDRDGRLVEVYERALGDGR